MVDASSEDFGNAGVLGLSESADRSHALDLIALRLVAWKHRGRLEHPIGLGYMVVAGQLSELVLAGVLADAGGYPVVVSDTPVASGGFDSLRERLKALHGSRWDQLFWRRGVGSEALFNDALAWLDDHGAGEVERKGRKQRPVRFVDHLPNWANTNQLSIEAVLAGTANPAPRASVLAALYRLGLGPRGHDTSPWLPGTWIVNQPKLPGPEQDTLLTIMTVAQTLFTANYADPSAGGGG